MRKKHSDPIDKHVGARVRMRRMMLGLSQEKLGDKLELTFQQVQKYEKGTNRISASKLHQIARILQVTVAYFFEGLAGEPVMPGQPVRGDLTAEFFSLAHSAELAEFFVDIEATADRHVVVTVARALARKSAALRVAAE